MGAASSIQHIYKDAVIWFREYFNCEEYEADFNEISKYNSDGVITMEHVKEWLFSQKRKEEKMVSLNSKSHWGMLNCSPEVVKLAFENSALQLSVILDTDQHHVVDIAHFRSLLINIFVISILCIHFRKADSLLDRFAFDDRLSYEEFRFAIHTVAACYEQIALTEEIIQQDYAVLDETGQGWITFAQIIEADTVQAKIDVIHATDHVILEQIAHSIKELPIDIIHELNSQPTVDELEALSSLQPASSSQTLQGGEQSPSCPTAIPINPHHGGAGTEHGVTRSSMEQALGMIAMEMAKNEEIASLEAMRLETMALIGIPLHPEH